MATEPGVIDVGISDQLDNTGLFILGIAIGGTPAWAAASVRNGELLEALDEAERAGTETLVVIVATPKTEPGVLDEPTVASDFFDRIIVLPKSINTGIVLGILEFTIEIYNSFRTQQHSFDSFTNNVGEGTSITDLPTLPSIISAQDSQLLTFQVLPVGPTTIIGTLDFVFDVSSASIPVTGSRSIVWPFEPEIPMQELLISKTDILRKSAGTEQRRAGRLSPRQVFEMRFSLEGADRNAMDTIIMSSQSQAVGLPIRHEAALSTAAVAINDTSISVDETSFADFRVGGLAIIWDDAVLNETLQISSVTSTTIGFATPFTNVFRSGVQVMPMRTAFMSSQIQGTKFPLNLQETTVRFTVLDNDVDLSDTSAFPTFNSKVLLDEPNMIRGTLRETMSRRIVNVDSEVGLFARFSNESISRRGHVKLFFSDSRQRLWEVRQLLHALKGRQISFYIPTFFPEFTVKADLASGSVLIDITNMGYTTLLQSAQPRNIIRVVVNDGTKLIRTVLSSIEVDSETERLTVDSTWGVNVPLANIERVEYVEKVRADSDEIRIIHESGQGDATIQMPIITVNE